MNYQKVNLRHKLQKCLENALPNCKKLTIIIMKARKLYRTKGGEHIERADQD